ncbi:MAG: TaqI-like C-terminal specificity domain-containing protein, partial [Phycisphaerae bacterium]
KERLITDNPDAPHARPYLEGRDIGRYSVKPTGCYIRYLPDEMYSPRTPALFEAKKLESQTMLSKMRLVATLDDHGYYVEQSLLCVIPHGILTPCIDLPQYSLEFVLGIMNSTLSSFYYATWIIDYSLGGGLVHATPGSQGKLLVPKIGPTKTAGIVGCVRDLLDLHKQLAAAKTPTDKTALQRQIDATDRRIDRLVYELYDLTDDEIRIVEEATK